jgi:hypothetical protein
MNLSFKSANLFFLRRLSLILFLPSSFFCSVQNSFRNARLKKVPLQVNSLKGQSHEKVYEFLTWDGSFSLQCKLRFAYYFKNFKVARLEAMIFQTWGLSM